MGAWFVNYFNSKPIPWNYRRSARIVRAGYKGLHNLSTLIAGCQLEKNATGRSANADVVRLAAPLSFERDTQVFDLTPRRFQFGHDKHAGYRIPFIFVEDGVIKVYFIQPRKGAGLDLDDFCFVATAVKRYLLDVEFFGERTDVEFVDVSVQEEGGERVLRSFSLADLKLLSERKFSDRLTLISQALDWAISSEKVEERKRVIRRPEPDMPLFD